MSPRRKNCKRTVFDFVDVPDTPPSKKYGAFNKFRAAPEEIILKPSRSLRDLEPLSEYVDVLKLSPNQKNEEAEEARVPSMTLVEGTSVTLTLKEALIGGTLVFDLSISFTPTLVRLQFASPLSPNLATDLAFNTASMTMKSKYRTHTHDVPALVVLELRAGTDVSAEAKPFLNGSHSGLLSRSIIWEHGNREWVEAQRQIINICEWHPRGGQSASWSRLEETSDRELIEKYMDALKGPGNRTESAAREPAERSREAAVPVQILSVSGRKRRRESIRDFVYPLDDPDAVTVSNQDLEILDNPSEFLNDTIIDFYMKYMQKTMVDERDAGRFHFFNSFFYKKLVEPGLDVKGQRMSEVAFNRVRKWTRKIDIFNKDYIIVPIHESAHWSLAIICHPGDIVCPPGKFGRGKRISGGGSVSHPTACVIHLDSLRVQGGHPEQMVFKKLKSYLVELWISVRGVSREVANGIFDNLKLHVANVPQQTNFCDCGLFLLHYVDYFIQQNPDSINLNRDHPKYPHFLDEAWFKPQEASAKRSFLRDLVLDLYHSSSQIQPGGSHGSPSEGQGLCSAMKSSQGDRESDVEPLSQPPVTVRPAAEGSSAMAASCPPVDRGSSEACDKVKIESPDKSFMIGSPSEHGGPLDRYLHVPVVAGRPLLIEWHALERLPEAQGVDLLVSGGLGLGEMSGQLAASLLQGSLASAEVDAEVDELAVELQKVSRLSERDAIGAETGAETAIAEAETAAAGIEVETGAAAAAEAEATGMDSAGEPPCSGLHLSIDESDGDTAADMCRSEASLPGRSPEYLSLDMADSVKSECASKSVLGHWDDDSQGMDPAKSEPCSPNLVAPSSKPASPSLGALSPERPLSDHLRPLRERCGMAGNSDSSVGRMLAIASCLSMDDKCTQRSAIARRLRSRAKRSDGSVLESESVAPAMQQSGRLFEEEGRLQINLSSDDET